MLYDLELETRLKFATDNENIWSYSRLEHIEKYNDAYDTAMRWSNPTNPNTIRLTMLTTCNEAFYSSNAIPLRNSILITKAP